MYSRGLGQLTESKRARLGRISKEPRSIACGLAAKETASSSIACSKTLCRCNISPAKSACRKRDQIKSELCALKTGNNGDGH